MKTRSPTLPPPRVAAARLSEGATVDYRGTTRGPRMQRPSAAIPRDTAPPSSEAKRVLGGFFEGVVRRGDVDVQSQAELLALHGVMRIEGKLTLRGPEIESLDVLEHLRSVSGDVEVRGCPNLTSLQGLGKLQGVGGLSISTCPRVTTLSQLRALRRAPRLTFADIGLTDLRGLENLTQVDRLKLTDMQRLASLRGLEGVTEAGTIEIWTAPSLRSLDGLDNMRSARSLRLQRAALHSVAGLGMLESLTERLSIIDCPDLSSLAALGKLKSVGGLVLSGLPNVTTLSHLRALERTSVVTLQKNGVTNLSGLERLTHLDHLAISDMPHLSSLRGLENVTQIGSVTIKNTSLTSLVGLDALESVPNRLAFEDNARLVQLDGLPKLRTVGVLAIVCNRSLERVVAFDALEEITQKLLLYSNPLLVHAGSFSSLTSVADADVDRRPTFPPTLKRLLSL